MKAVALHPAESKWTMMSGPLKGAVQVLSHPMLVIGRSSECDIVIVEDPKCSRKHAKVEWTTHGFEIQVLSSSNALKVNGRSVEQSLLEDGDIIACGGTELKFNLVAAKSARKEPSVRVVTTAPQPQQVTPIQSHPGYAPFPQTPHQTIRTKGKKKPFPTRLIIYGVVALIGLWVFTGGPIKKKTDVPIRTEEQIKNDIEAAEKLREAAEAMRANTNLSPRFEVRQAQENFVRGFRDFRKGQFERSVEAFQACLALYPDHLLCNRYLRLSQKKFSELVQYNMVLGRKYRDQNQFRACRNAFRNVMVMVKDSSSAAYKEAKANFDACNALVEGHY